MNTSSNSELAGLARIFWMMLGPLVLLLLILSIAHETAGWFTLQDWGFFLVLGAVMLARWYEFHDGSGQTAVGEPAAPKDLRKYLSGALALGLGVWVAANLLGQYR